MKIAFHPMGKKGWLGGGIYLQTLCQALKQTNGSTVSLALVTQNGYLSGDSQMSELIDEVITYASIKRWTSAWVKDTLSFKLRGHGVANNQVLRARRVDVIAFGEAPEGSTIPALGWLPDFQHRRFPEFFSDDECHHRDASFARVAERSARVILIGESVQKDFAEFLPTFRDRSRVLRPITIIPESVYNSDPGPVCQLYNLPHKFFYLPNQFWKHKNHVTVFRALSILKKKGVRVFVVCSGHPGDYRHPELFSELVQEISRLDVREHIALLGVLPREHVFQIMRQSVAVLNPSLFEGWGMTVDEAHSIGKPAILSDIAAHREQNPSRAVFFHPLDDEALAEQMQEMWAENAPGPDAQRETASRSEAPERIRDYAESFLEIAREVVN